MKRPSLERIASIAGVLALIVAVVTLWYMRYTQQVKGLGVFQMDRRPLITRDMNDPVNRESKALQILFEGREVESPWASSIEIVCIGNVPIEQKDIERPIVISLAPAVVLSAEIVKTSPMGIGVTLSHTSHDLDIEHTLLNPGDRMTISVISDGEPILNSVDCRISGLRAPTVADLSADSIPGKEPYFNWPRVLGIILTAIVTGVLALFIGWLLVGWWMISSGQLTRAGPTTDEVITKIRTAVQCPVRFFGVKLGVTPIAPRLQEILKDKCFPDEWLDNPHSLETELSTPECEAALKNINMTREHAVTTIHRFMKSWRKTLLAKELNYATMPAWSRELVAAIKSLEFSTTSELLEKVCGLVHENPPELAPAWQNRSIVLRTALFMFVAVAFFCSVVGYIIYVLWRAIL